MRADAADFCRRKIEIVPAIKNMTSTVFPHEIIDEIMTYWGGHRLGLTCSTLLARMNIDDFATVSKWVGPDESVATTSSMPNGAFHGKSRFRTSVMRRSAEYIATYNRGFIQRVDMILMPSRLLVVRTALIRGHKCQWMPGSSTIHIEDEKIPFEERRLNKFDDAVLHHIGDRVGPSTTIPTLSEYLVGIFPQTHYLYLTAVSGVNDTDFFQPKIEISAQDEK